MDTADQLQARSRIFAALTAIGFFAWQAADGLARSDFAPEGLVGPAYLISGVGAGLWIVSLILLLGAAFQARARGLFDVLNDELAVATRRKAMETAFYINTFTAVIFMTLGEFDVDRQFLLKTLVGVSVASFLLAYVWYDARDPAPS